MNAMKKALILKNYLKLKKRSRKDYGEILKLINTACQFMESEKTISLDGYKIVKDY
jgi:hypothetical protein